MYGVRVVAEPCVCDADNAVAFASPDGGLHREEEDDREKAHFDEDIERFGRLGGYNVEAVEAWRGGGSISRQEAKGVWTLAKRPVRFVTSENDEQTSHNILTLSAEQCTPSAYRHVESADANILLWTT